LFASRRVVGVTVIVTVAETVPEVVLMVEVPQFDIAVASPPLVIMTFDGVPDVHVTLLVRF
jgi:hypothetical protein